MVVESVRDNRGLSAVPSLPGPPMPSVIVKMSLLLSWWGCHGAAPTDATQLAAGVAFASGLNPWTSVV